MSPKSVTKLMARSDGENPEGNENTDLLWFMNDDDNGYYQMPEYHPDIAPMNSSSLNNDGRDLSSMFDLLAISTPNAHCRVSRNIPVADDNNTSSNSINNSSVDWSVSPALLHQAQNASLMRMRAQSAALGQIGFSAPRQNYPSSDHYNNFNPFIGNHSSNFGGRSIMNAGASVYQPHAYQNQLNSSLREQNFYSNSAYMHNGFRTRANFDSLGDRRARILFLEKKLEEGNSEEIRVIFSKVKNRVRELMVDRLGNLFIQRFFEKCNQEEIDQLLLLVFNDQHVLMVICADTYGTRSMQKLLENLTTPEQRFLVVSVLTRLTISLSKSLCGRHVIQHCLIYFLSEETKHIQRLLARYCLDFAVDRNGCCVIQVCAEHTRGGYRNHILEQVAENAVFLSEHPYGNYVVSKLVTLRIPHVTAEILAQLAGSFVSLSMNKHGSNVVETCLRETRGDVPLQIVKEIINSPYFLTVLQDPYGNYVAQSALDISKGNNVHATMIRLIRGHFRSLQSHLHGKRVLARVTRSESRA